MILGIFIWTLHDVVGLIFLGIFIISILFVFIRAVVLDAVVRIKRWFKRNKIHLK